MVTDTSKAGVRQYPGSSVSVSCNVMTTILYHSRRIAGGARHRAVGGNRAVGSNTDGLVTNTSKAGVRQHGSR